MKLMLASIALAVAMATTAAAQISTPTGAGAASQARPSRGPEQTSVPNAAPAATTGQTTASKSQDPTVKQMNQAEEKKVEDFGK